MVAPTNHRTKLSRIAFDTQFKTALSTMQAGFPTVDNLLKIYGLPCITIFPIGGEKSVMGPEE